MVNPIIISNYHKKGGSLFLIPNVMGGVSTSGFVRGFLFQIPALLIALYREKAMLSRTSRH